jgi:hypothetical protein
MMKRSNSKLGGYRAAFGCAILLFCLASPGYCEEDGTALMLQMSPVDGGTLNLSPGVYTYDRDTEVTLTAVPRSGYQFVYWLGNVTDATASTTTVYLDAPKIVIAVFERSKFAFVELEEGPQGSLGSGGLIASGPDYAAALEQAVGVRRSSRNSYSGGSSPETPPETNEDVPVPEEGNDFPVPVPEPATIAFILTGMLSLAKCRRKRAEVGEVHRQTL